MSKILHMPAKINYDTTEEKLQYLLSRIEISTTSFYNGTPCWEWTKSLNADGYGHFGLNGTMYRSHREIYKCIKGEIPKGLEIDHLCKNRKCCSPIHVEAVTHLENMLRSDAGAHMKEREGSKTHCRYGHEYTEENTKFQKAEKEGRMPKRQCRKCAAITQQRLREQKKLVRQQ